MWLSASLCKILKMGLMLPWLEGQIPSGPPFPSLIREIPLASAQLK